MVIVSLSCLLQHPGDKIGGDNCILNQYIHPCVYLNVHTYVHIWVTVKWFLKEIYLLRRRKKLIIAYIYFKKVLSARLFNATESQQNQRATDEQSDITQRFIILFICM